MGGFVDKIGGFISDISGFDVTKVVPGLTGQLGADASMQGAQLQYQSSKEARDQLERLNAPYLNLGRDSIPAFQRMLTPQGQQEFLKTNPMFQAAIANTGSQLKGAGAAAGKFNSGGMVNQLFQNYLGQGEQFVNNQFNRLLSPVTLGQNAANFQGASASDLITGGGNALAAGGVGAANSYAQGGANVAGIGGALAAFFSDERLKEGMEPIGKDENGMTLYKFRYKIDNPLFVGYSAQEVAQKDPENAMRDHSGFLKVSAKYKPQRVA